MNFLIQFLIVLALQVVAYVLTPKPKQSKPVAAQDLDDPTADAGRPRPVVFGTVTVKGLNVLWFDEKRTATYRTK